MGVATRKYLGKLPQIGKYLNAQSEADFFSLALDDEWKVLLPVFIKKESVAILKSTENLGAGTVGYIIQLKDLDNDDVNIPIYLTEGKITLKDFSWGVDSVVVDFLRKEMVVWLIQQSFPDHGGNRLWEL